ncbi:hypothetical protein CRUP_001682 [Coryphaenoides rupestris]|nr:hypothetical protein CRUP_001682 [Coryphaenoides rupestris]
MSASQPGRQAGRQEGRKAGRKAGREAGRQCDTNGLFFSRAPPGGRRLSRKVGLSANTSQFTLAGEPFRILGGSMHYFRVPRAYWRDRLMKTKACGINTVTTYYISLAAELGLWVILRPGPYVSAGLDLGGLPSWLLRDGNMRVRTTYPGFTHAVNVFFDKLIPKIVPLQALTSRGVSELLITSDHRNGLRAGGVFVNREYVGFFKRRSLEMVLPDGQGKRTLSLLVENCGRVHQGQDLDKQRKGLVGDVLLNGAPLRDFTIYSLDMKPSFIDRFVVPAFPAFFRGALFAYGYPSDTFVKLPGWGKGVLFLNGLNWGRYWSHGPQQALYLAGPLLNSGMNQIVVFEEQEADYKVQLEETHDLGMVADIQ